jgi:hypothetical protein
MKLRQFLLPSALLLFLVSSASPGWTIQPERLPETTRWEGSQFVRADRAGNVFLLRADTLELYPLGKSGVPGKPVRLEATSTAAGSIREAAMSPSGDRWFLLSGMTVRLFEDGKEKVLPPLEWKPWSLTLLGGTPIVAAAPFPLGGRSVDPKRIGTPPWLLRFDGDRWASTLDLKGVSVADLFEHGDLNDAIAKNSVTMAGDRQGRLWAARQYGYRIQKFTGGGRLLLEITVDRGKIRQKTESRGIEIKLKDGQAATGDATQGAQPQKGSYFPFTAERVVYALTEGRDGKMYFVVDSGSGSASLDRFDPVRTVLERTPIAIPLKHTATLAAGKDALYLASWEADGGRWRISWSDLETAPWKPVKAQIDGFAPDSESGASQ